MSTGRARASTAEEAHAEAKEAGAVEVEKAPEPEPELLAGALRSAAEDAGSGASSRVGSLTDEGDGKGGGGAGCALCRGQVASMSEQSREAERARLVAA